MMSAFRLLFLVLPLHLHALDEDKLLLQLKSQTHTNMTTTTGRVMSQPRVIPDLKPDGAPTHHCFYQKMPDDAKYHATAFDFTDGTGGQIEFAIMYTISAQAVQLLKMKGKDLSQPFDCTSPESVMLAIHAGGFLIFQLSPKAGEAAEVVPADSGYEVGQGTARQHVLMRVVYSKKPGGQSHDTGTGFEFPLTTELRAKSIGEWKFATSTGAGAKALTLPPGQPSVVHFAEAHSATLQTLLTAPLRILDYRMLGRKYLRSWKLVESDDVGQNPMPGVGEVCPFGYTISVFPSVPMQRQWRTVIGGFYDYETRTSQFTPLNGDVRIDPTKTYRLICNYDTTTATAPVVGGYGEDDEVCQLFVHYEEVHGNVPYPGYFMDMAPYQLRNPVSAQQMMQNPQNLQAFMRQMQQAQGGGLNAQAPQCEPLDYGASLLQPGHSEPFDYDAIGEADTFW